MITRMLLSLKRTSAKSLCQSWYAIEINEGLLDSPSSPRVVRGGARFPNPVPHGQIGNVIPIQMEIIHIRDERCYV